MYKILRQKKLCKEEIVGWFELGFFLFSANDCCLAGRAGRMLLIYHSRTMKISFNRFKN